MNHDEAIQAALDMASKATSLSTGLLLLLWRQGLLPDESAQDFEALLRKMAKDMEKNGCAPAATDLWTAANLLAKRPSKDLG